MAAVGGEVSKGWREQLEREMKAALDGINAITDDENEENEPARFLPRQKSALKSKIEGFESMASDLDRANATVAALEEETKRIHYDLHRLDSQNSKVLDELERKKAEYEGEVRRNGRVKEAIGRSRGMSRGFARGIADKVSFERWGAREKILFVTFCIYLELDFCCRVFWNVVAC